MASIINTGISALNAFKRQMETTGHNIANVNTEGYSRQVVQFGTRLPQATPQGDIGSGVEVASITRAYDEYLVSRVRDYNSSYEEYAVYQERSRQIDNVIADASAGVDEMLQQFFNALNDTADDPTSIPARQVVLNRAEQLSDRFNSLDGWLEDIRKQLNGDFEQKVTDVNLIAKSLAEVNLRVRSMSSGRVPNDILDERDKLIDELSGFTDVSTLEQDDGSMNVFIGTGQPLVLGTSYNTLGVTNNSLVADHKELVIQQAGGLSVNVTSQMSGGSIGGLLRFRDEVLDEAQNALGRVAVGISSFFNEEHRTGMDLDGELGGDFFATAAPQVLADPGNSGTIAVTFDDVSLLTTHDYQLDYDGTNWSLTDLDSASSVALSGTGSVANPLTADGLSIVVSGGAAGDSYRVRPTRGGASGIEVLVSNARDIAAAEAVRINALAGNTGTGSVGGGAMTTRTGTTLLGTQTPSSIAIRYQAGNQLAISSAPAGTVFIDANGNSLGASVGYVAGQDYRVSIPGLGAFDFDLTGSPALNDSFVIADNTGGVGDNRNARRLADLQDANVMMGGTASLANTYGALIADVGTKTHQAGSNAAVQEHLLSQAEAAKAEVSGVNLDEEAADLVRFQQAYQAAAQVISVANSLFDSLLSAVRR